MSAPTTVTSVTDRAWRWWAVGASPVPVREDGSKAPIGTWKQFTEVQPTEGQMRSAFGAPGTDGKAGGFGLVLGVSGLECLETEDAAVEVAFVAACRAQGYGPLLERVTAGYADRGPGGGVHRLYRVEHPVANTKLASRREYSPKEADKQRAAGRAEHDGQGQNATQVLIETRGAGGFIICAPSAGPTLHRGKMPRFLTEADYLAGRELHGPIRGGRPYTDVGGSPEGVVTITDAERDALYAVARTLDEMPAPAAPARAWTGERAREARLTGGESVGDWFNAAVTWPEVMEGLLGWTHGGGRGEEDLWLRPGDTNAERSAVSNHGGNDRLTIFSSAVEWAGQPAPGANYPSHDKFGAVARALHGGDFTAAARWVHENYPDAPGQPTILPPGWRWAKPTVSDFMAGRTRMEPDPDAQVAPGATAPIDERATDAEVEAWLATYTRFSRPARLGRRVEWMRCSQPEDLYRHALALVHDSLDGYIPAEKAVTALRDAYRDTGGTDTTVVHGLIAYALGVVLNAKVGSP